jgi:hypothetical protein
VRNYISEMGFTRIDSNTVELKAVLTQAEFFLFLHGLGAMAGSADQKYLTRFLALANRFMEGSPSYVPYDESGIHDETSAENTNAKMPN